MLGFMGNCLVNRFLTSASSRVKMLKTAEVSATILNTLYDVKTCSVENAAKATA